MAKLILDKTAVRYTGITEVFPLVNKTMNETLELSKRYVPVRKPRAFDRRATGRLKRSLRKVGPRKGVWSVAGKVGSTLRYAASVHEGAQAHVIRARNEPNLVFFWEREGVTFVGKKVRHPGVRHFARKQYLFLPLAIVGRRNGFVVRRKTPLTSPLP